LKQLPPIAPETVLDANEPDLERGRLMGFPDRVAALTVWLRRHLPGLLWRNIHRRERLQPPIRPPPLARPPRPSQTRDARPPGRRALVRRSASLLALAASLAAAAPAFAADIEVKTIANDAPPSLCTLRRAIQNANNDDNWNPGCNEGSGHDTIRFDIDTDG